jgi:malate dehydrogenase
VLGAAGGIGQPLALLLKNSPNITKLSLFDIVGAPGVAADLSHIETRAEVKGYVSAEQLNEALQGCDVVVIPAGVPRKPGKTLLVASQQMDSLVCHHSRDEQR